MSEYLHQSQPIEAEFIERFVRMATDSWDAGWHERNGGNLSYRMTEQDVELSNASMYDGEWIPLADGVQSKEMAGEFLLITAAGSFFRNVQLDPASCIGVVEIGEDGSTYRKRWGFAGDGKPTSELSAHVLAHGARKAATGGKNRVIHHAHPANTIALTFVLPLDGTEFTRALYGMISECAMVFPEGLGVLGWMVPGSAELGKATAKEMESHNAVIWAHHGVFCAGESFDLAFGLLHTIEKASEILVKVLSMKPDAASTISDDNLMDMSDAYDLKLEI